MIAAALLGLRPGLVQGFGSIVHVGAGSGAVLADHAALAPERLVLVEGDPEARSALEEQARARPGVEVEGAAVAAAGGALRWRRYNLSTLNGPVDWRPLSTFYPRLRQVGTGTLEAVAFGDLLRRWAPPIDATGSHVLVLDVPGQEDALLAAAPAELLYRFEIIVVRGCAAPAPAGTAAADAALHRLRGLGWQPVPVAQDTDPLWPVALLRIDARAAALRRLHEQVQGLEQRVAEQDGAASRAAAEHAQAVETLAAQLRGSTAALRAAEKLAHERAAELQAAADARAAAERAADERQVQLNKLVKERDQLTAERDAQVKRVQQLQQELGEARQTASLMSKLNLLRDADLRDLQARYEQALTKQQSQHELLSRLAQRLSVANEYFQRLSADGAAGAWPDAAPADPPRVR